MVRGLTDGLATSLASIFGAANRIAAEIARRDWNACSVATDSGPMYGR